MKKTIQKSVYYFFLPLAVFYLVFFLYSGKPESFLPLLLSHGDISISSYIVMLAGFFALMIFVPFWLMSYFTNLFAEKKKYLVFFAFFVNFGISLIFWYAYMLLFNSLKGEFTHFLSTAGNYYHYVINIMLCLIAAVLKNKKFVQPVAAVGEPVNKISGVSKKIIFSTGLVIGLLAVIYIVLFAYNYYQLETGKLIFWQGKPYTKEELKKIIPPQVYDVPSKNTPEEVYKTFRQALLDGDIEGALGQMRDKRRAEYREAFKNKEKFDKWVKSLPEKFEKEKEDGNHAYYDWEKNDGYKHSIIFIKNQSGNWQIDVI